MFETIIVFISKTVFFIAIGGVVGFVGFCILIYLPWLFWTSIDSRVEPMTDKLLKKYNKIIADWWKNLSLTMWYNKKMEQLHDKLMSEKRRK